MTSQPPGLCIICERSTSKTCGRCNSARYCSKTCQQKDWATHKLFCADFAKFDNSTRPTKKHVKAMLFPVNEGKPKLVWLHWSWGGSEDVGYTQIAEFVPFLGPDSHATLTTIQYNPILKRTPSDTSYVGYRDLFVYDGSDFNKSTSVLERRWRGYSQPVWRGHVIVWGMEGLGDDFEPSICKDIDMNDFRHIADYFLAHNIIEMPRVTAILAAATIEGVRINCYGDQKMLSKPRFEKVKASSAHPVFKDLLKNGAPDVAQRVGLPVLTWRYSPDERWATDQANAMFDDNPFNNPDAAYLHVSCDPETKTTQKYGTASWGSIPSNYQSELGSILVVRQDKKPLSLLVVETLCKYARMEVQPLLMRADTGGDLGQENPLSKRAVLTKINHPNFATYWLKLLSEKRDNNEDVDATDPYGL